FLVGSLLWGSSGVSSGSGVEVVEWSRKWGKGGNGAGGKNGQGATVHAILNGEDKNFCPSSHICHLQE
nr:hypothetical protein [Tanacetum cinerariifolium]